MLPRPVDRSLTAVGEDENLSSAAPDPLDRLAMGPTSIAETDFGVRTTPTV